MLVVCSAGICGGSASGKTTVARKIIEELDVQWVSLVCMDSFYRVICSTFVMFSTVGLVESVRWTNK